jgi:CubicO group peptidase (beta-lactamase class C family)
MPSNFAPKDPNNPYADYTVKQMYDFLSSYTLPRDPGKQYEYSNLGMGLLGHALALRAGLSYEALVTKRILEPLGMRDTRIALTPSMTARLAQGHNEGGQPVANWDLPTFAGAGAIRSTADDMLRFLAAALDTTTGPLARDLALAEVPRRPVTDNGKLRIGLGWHVLTGPGGEIVWHNGQTGGYHAFIAVNHATGANVVILSASAADIDDIGMHLIDARFPLREPKKVHVEVAIDPSMLDQYVGVYEFAPTFSITVTKDGTSLWAQATGQGKVQLFPESPTDFFLKALEASVSFVKDASGAVTTMVLHQGGMDQNGKRVR